MVVDQSPHLVDHKQETMLKKTWIHLASKWQSCRRFHQPTGSPPSPAGDRRKCWINQSKYGGCTLSIIEPKKTISSRVIKTCKNLPTTGCFLKGHIYKRRILHCHDWFLVGGILAWWWRAGDVLPGEFGGLQKSDRINWTYKSVKVKALNIFQSLGRFIRKQSRRSDDTRTRITECTENNAIIGAKAPILGCAISTLPMPI